MLHNYRDNGDTPSINAFFNAHPYPFCKAVDSLATLRTGIAIAEVLTDKLPSVYHPLFLPNIQIYHPTPQRSLMNLRVILNTLRAYYAQHPQLGVSIEDFNAQGLYFDHNMMETFIFTALMPLPIAQQETPNDQALRQAYLAVEEISDIANLSSIMIPEQKHQEFVEHQPLRPSTNNSSNFQKTTSAQRQEMRLERIEEWLRQAHHIETKDLAPEQIMGELVNSMFAGSRLDHTKIIKRCHYQLGSVTVFKKVCNYLLSCQRMPKQRVLALLDQVEAGSIREQLFWGVIEDMMNIRASLHHKMSSKNISSRKQLTKTSLEKENVSPNNIHIVAPQQPIKPKEPQIYKMSNQSIKKAQDWISKQLGYEYSLNKSKSAINITENPLLNGILLGSIVMRMQLGKISINKQPKSKKQVEKNITEVINCIIRRGIEAGRKFNHFTPTYKTYLGIIWEVFEQWQLKSQLEKTRRTEMAREKREPFKEISEEERGVLSEWLQSRGFDLKSLDYLPSQVLSSVCGELLQLRLLRQTTKRIKETNMVKILEELRRLGWRQEYGVQQILQESNTPLRWQILRFAKQLLSHNVYYYR